MENRIKVAVAEIQAYWENPTMESVMGIQSVISSLACDPAVQVYLKNEVKGTESGIELHRDSERGFILLAYTESQGLYRAPHDHGDAWVVYAVLSGVMEMGSYFRFKFQNEQHQLVQKQVEELSMGATRTYFPGEIHDTRCVSEGAVILRLTSLDLKVEQRLGRMHHYRL